MFLTLLGDSGILDDKISSNNLSDANGGLSNIDNLTSSVLEAIGQTFGGGGIDIAEFGDLSGNGTSTLDQFLNDDALLPIFNDFTILIDDDKQQSNFTQVIENNGTANGL